MEKCVPAEIGYKAELAQTVKDTLAWERSRGPHSWSAGLERDQERKLLEEWNTVANRPG